MRVAVVCFLLALAAFAAQSAVWLRLAAVPLAPVEPTALLDSFLRANEGLPVDLVDRYRGRADLLDPRTTLPSWHKADRAEAVRVHELLANCPVPLEPRPQNAALAKALDWHQSTCAGGLPEDAASRWSSPPFMHPGGRSYAALARARGAKPPARDFHVLELAAADIDLAPEERALAELPSSAWVAVLRGDTIVLGPTALVFAEQAPLGLSRLRFFPRDAWERHARTLGAALIERTPTATCARPASVDLCWETLPVAKRYEWLRSVTFFGSAFFLAASAAGLVVLVARERRRAHADRVHVLRTLTHELRTPATSLKLEVEPLRAAYDELPASCQEPLLRLSDGVERLLRVLHRSARYMALFETQDHEAKTLLRWRDVPSLRALFEAFREEWPEGVELHEGSADCELRTDPEWLGVAVRNLVENAVRHGEPPVVVTWRVAGDVLFVRVRDSGNSPGFSLRDASRPFQRASSSEGLGLGLSIVGSVAKLFGGKLVHESTPTTFELRLPLSRGDA